ncbi:MAG: ATP-binding protein, partial [Cyanobacteria bacterium REEB498]|nr:ATP-binding protein [Cyanobacteria bacterium REEB498]
LEAFRSRVKEKCVPLDCSDQADGRSGHQVFIEGLTALAAHPPSLPSGPPAAHPAPPARPSYTAAALDAWVATHQRRLATAFNGLLTVQNRRVHVPLEVCVTLAGAAAPEGPRLLQPTDLTPVLTAGGAQVLLLSGDGGAGKTSLAIAIARWLMAGEPDGVVRLPVLIETALAPKETVADRVGRWLGEQLGTQEPALVEALLVAQRLIPIVDHLSELAPTAREQLLASLPPGLVIITSRSGDDGYRERPLSRIVPQRIAVKQLQLFFLEYLSRRGLNQALTEDDLMPAQAQLKRIVGNKDITVLLAQLFIDDVIANRDKGLLAGSVPELMLSYVRQLDTPTDRAQRRQAGLEISEALVQRALRVVALASHRQGPSGQPLFQPLEFSMGLAREALMAAEPLGLGLEQPQAQALLAYLIDLRLLQRPGAAADRLRFPLDPLADHLAAAEQLEQLEEQARVQGPAVWEAFVAALEPRPQVERERMRDFLLALRDGVMAAQPRRALLMPPGIPDRLAQLGYLDPDDERYRLALQRARKWMWELGVPLASERRDGIAKLAAMAAAVEDSERRAARDVACRRLARLLAEELSEQQVERQQEQQEAALVLGLMGSPQALAALQSLAADPDQPQQLRRKALESLGLAARRLPGVQGARQRAQIETFLKQWLHSDRLELLVDDEGGWAEHDRRLPLLQGASRG